MALLPRSLNSAFAFPSTSVHPRVNRNSLETGQVVSNVRRACESDGLVDWSFLSARKKVVRAHGKTASRGATRRRLSGSRRPRRGFQNGTLSRINRANEAVWLRQERRLYFSPTHRARLSTCPSIHPFRLFMVDRIRGRGGRCRHPGGRDETPWRNVARRRLTWHAVPLDKNVTRTKLTSLSRPSHTRRRSSRRL